RRASILGSSHHCVVDPGRDAARDGAGEEAPDELSYAEAEATTAHHPAAADTRPATDGAVHQTTPAAAHHAARRAHRPTEEQDYDRSGDAEGDGEGTRAQTRGGTVPGDVRRLLCHGLVSLCIVIQSVWCGCR